MSNIPSLKILVIEDDEEDFMILRDTINDLQHLKTEITWAESYVKGKELIASNSHDIHFVDYYLGSKSGLELIEDAVKSGVAKPMILLTGLNNRDVDIQAIQVGAADYIAKGDLSAEILDRSIRHSLERYNQNLLVKTEQKRYQNLFKNSIDAIYTTDINWQLLEVNNTFLKKFDLEEQFVSNYNLSDFFLNNRDFSDFISLQEYGIPKGSFGCELKQNEETNLTVTISFFSSLNKFNEVVGYQGVIHDLTDLKIAEGQLVEFEKFNLSGRLARMIGHEVRNPLTNINLAAEQIKEELQGMDDALMYMDMIMRNSNRIKDMIDQLLYSTKLIDLEIQENVIEDVVNDAIEICLDRIQLKNIELEKIGFQNVTIVPLDDERIKIAVVNIITNATEALAGTEKPKLTVEIKLEKEEAHILITDNGKGMDDEIKKNLFDAFFSKREGGMGLGMTTVKNIIIQHKGAINVESELGEGTTFDIVIPR